MSIIKKHTQKSSQSANTNKKMGAGQNQTVPTHEGSSLGTPQQAKVMKGGNAVESANNRSSQG